MKKTREVRPGVLVRESSSQLIRYSLDTGVRYSTYLPKRVEVFDVGNWKVIRENFPFHESRSHKSPWGKNGGDFRNNDVYQCWINIFVCFDAMLAQYIEVLGLIVGVVVE